MTTVHKNLTGADLHEPKGADTALSGTVYVSNGAGSGVWTAASSVITNTAFTTGDLKPTHKNVADTSWIMWVEGTIGDGSSGASIRANADTSALFQLYWNNCSDGDCPVSSGRGASAAADYASHKTLTLPRGPGRALGIAGSGTSLTARILGDFVGEETHLLSLFEIPAHNHSITDPGHDHLETSSNTGSGSAEIVFAPASGVIANTGPRTQPNFTGIGINNTGGGGAHNNMQPTTWVNVMIKL